MLECVFRPGEFDGVKAFSGFEISGHAGFGTAASEYEGNDIVCAAVSSCTMLVCNAITENFGAEAEIKVEENRISLKLTKPDSAAQKLISAFYEHLEMLSKDYKNNLRLRIV